MKALPDDKTAVVDDVETDGSAVGVIQIYSSQSEPEAEGEPWYEKNNIEGVDAEEEEEEEEEEEDENGNGHRRSKKKHKKHHHKRDDGSSAIRKRHKKRKKRVDPIFLWAQKRETKIVKVVCEDYDRHNRIRLVRTSSGLWSSNPRSKVLAAAKSRSSVFEYDDESQKDTDGESGSEPDTRPAEPEKLVDKPKDVGGVGDEQPVYVDLNDNSIDFVDTICAEEDEEEQRARIDRALEMIDRDPARVEDVKITFPTVETATIKLPEGTTIHQVKAENDTSVDKPTAMPAETLVQQKNPCNYGELTVIPQQLQQNEPLNLETVGKRSALEIRLQEPPFKKKRVTQSPSPHLSVVGGGVPVKREWGALCELKEVLADPRLSVPDPLLVPRARLAALVASPATEIPKLLQTTKSLLPLPPPDHDLLAVSLSHLRSIVQQHPPDYMGDSGNQPSNIDQMLWLSYLSSKDMTGMDADLLLNLLLPSSTTSQQSFNYAASKNQWNDLYYGGTGLPTPPTPAQYPPPPYGNSLVQRQSQLPSPQPRKLQQSPGQQQQNHKAPFTSQHRSRIPRPPSSPAKQRVVCQDLCCTGSPTACYEGCCPTKAMGCNPFAVSPNGCNAFAMSPNGCNPFALSPSGCNPFVMSPSGCNPFAASPTSGGGGGGGFYSSANLSKSCTVYSPVDPVPATCCFSPDIGFGFADGQQSSSPMPPPQKSSSMSSSPRNRVLYNYQTGLPPPSQHQKPTSADPSERVPNTDVVAASIDPQQCPDTATSDEPPPAAAPIASSDVAAQKPKIKVKKHLIDPNAKPKLLNIEGALHLAGANPQDLFSSPLWHPLFGSQEKRYGCRWQWTTPVTTSPTNSSKDASGKR